MFFGKSYSSTRSIRTQSHIVCKSCSEHRRKRPIWFSAHTYVIWNPFYILPAYGLDVLNRYRHKAQKHDHKAPQYRGQEKSENLEKLSHQDDHSTVHVMMYIFPREFGLHNVFTSFVDHRETVQPLKDYTLREEEIASKYGVMPKQDTGIKVRVPRRLRGIALGLVRKLRVSHSRCSYNKLLNQYCPSAVSSYILLMKPADQSGLLPKKFGNDNAANNS